MRYPFWVLLFIRRKYLASSFIPWYNGNSKKQIKRRCYMIIVNTDFISGHEIETMQLVKGNTIQTKNVGKDLTQGFKNLVGGELKSYTKMMNEARALATKRMVEEAEELGADGIVNVRYVSAEIMQGAAEVMAYGTAVKFVE
jgi:uncharacterized protein YbjQ (UPF0145 family)